MKECKPQTKLKKNLDAFDFKKKYPSIYKGTDGVLNVITLPAMSQIYVEGRGEPSGEDYQKAIGYLFGAAFTLKFMFKSLEVVFTVPPLQTNWWTDDDSIIFPEDKSLWHWKASVPLPLFITEKHFATAFEDMKKKGKIESDNTSLKFATLPPNTAVQMLRVGAYDEVFESINKLYGYIKENGFKPVGKYEEIYISDPRKTEAKKLKTLLRQRVEKLS